MLIKKADGCYTHEWLRKGIYQGALFPVRPTYEGPDTHPIRAGLTPYAGSPFHVAGIVWTCSPIPQPWFVAQFSDGAQGLLPMKQVLQGFRGIVAETEYARELSGSLAGVLRHPSALPSAA